MEATIVNGPCNGQTHQVKDPAPRYLVGEQPVDVAPVALAPGEQYPEARWARHRHRLIGVETLPAPPHKRAIYVHDARLDP